MDRKSFLTRIAGGMGLAILLPSIKIPKNDIENKSFIGENAGKDMHLGTEYNCLIGYKALYNRKILS